MRQHSMRSATGYRAISTTAGLRFLLVSCLFGVGACENPDGLFTATPNPATVGETVSFDARCSVPGSAATSIRDYHWDFDGNRQTDETGATATRQHVYPAVGMYRATLVVIDDANESDATSLLVEVRDPMSSATLVVEFQGTGTGTVTSEPGGMDCASTCSGIFMSGTSVTLAAVADADRCSWVSGETVRPARKIWCRS